MSLFFVVTSYSEYLDEAMRFHVFRYLSKPLDKQRFFRNLKDALAYYNSITLKIPVETKQAVYSFPASQIIAIEAQGRKVIVHTTRQDFDSIHNMDYWLEQLPKNSFFQTHRSFIVNFEHIVDFDHSTIHLSNQQIAAYLTRRKYSSFKNAYLLYLEKYGGKNKWDISFYFFLAFLQKQLYYGNTHPAFLPLLIAVK